MLPTFRRLFSQPTNPLDGASPLPATPSPSSNATPPHTSSLATPIDRPPRTLAESEAKVEKYFRRVAAENRLPTRTSKLLAVGGWVGGFIASTYMVLWADFGQHEHVFSPVRRYFHAYTQSVFTLSDSERSYLGLEQPLRKKDEVPGRPT